MARLSSFYEVSTPEIFRLPRMAWDDVRVIDITHEFGAGTSSNYVRRLIRRLHIDAYKNDEGNLCVIREDVEVMKDWHVHNSHKLR